MYPANKHYPKKIHSRSKSSSEKSTHIPLKFLGDFWVFSKEIPYRTKIRLTKLTKLWFGDENFYSNQRKYNSEKTFDVKNSKISKQKSRMSSMESSHCLHRSFWSFTQQATVWPFIIIFRKLQNNALAEIFRTANAYSLPKNHR